MFAWIRRFLAPPIFEDEDKMRVAGLLNTVLLTVLATTVMYGFFSLVAYPDPVAVLATLGVVVLVVLGGLFLMRRGRVQLASMLLSSALWVIVTFLTIATGGVRTPGFFTYIASILIAGLLLGGWAGIGFAGLSILVGLGLLYAEINSLLPQPFIPITSAIAWGVVTMDFILVSVLLYLATRSINEALERARRNERTLAEANEGLQREITERKRAEEAMKEYAARLEEMVEERTKELRDAQEQLVRREKLAVLGQLAGGVGHELRNPLGVISNAIYFLQMTLADADETTREYLDIVSSEIGDAGKIVSDLLDFSHTRAMEKEEIVVSDLVTQVLAKQPPPENVEVVTEIAADLPPVYVDSRQMEQVLVNLITNAYQAMPEGGRLVIKTSASSVEPSGWVALSITDTGCGIPQENMGKIFEPLFTTKARGIGLGLALVRTLMDANGGSVEVESEVGKGSTFMVRLPIQGVIA